MAKTIYDVTEQDEQDWSLKYTRCLDCSNFYASSILDKCPICETRLSEDDLARFYACHPAD